jgi:hypothetical protein
MLNRLLVEKLCLEEGDNELKTKFKDVYAPAEYYYYTYIKVLKLEDEIIITNNLGNNATTFTNWQGMDYIMPSMFGLYKYDSITPYELTYLMIYSKCLFGRKFNTKCNDCLNNNQNYINFITNK